MGFRIATNTQSMNAQRTMNISSESANSSMEKLSSGFRINKASDDAAGLAISEKLKADYKGLLGAKRNANDGISLIQTAESGLSGIGNILIRLRELAIQGASDTITDKERSFLNKEFVSLKDEINRITSSTEFNGTPLIAGEGENFPEEMKLYANKSPLEIQVGQNYYSSIDGLDKENPTNIIRLDLSQLNATVDGLKIGAGDEVTSVKDKVSSQLSLSSLDDAISEIASQRSILGALQNRLNSTVEQLSVRVENNAATNSRIRDTDFAEETAKMTQANILRQSGVSILTQANQLPQLALRLLG